MIERYEDQQIAEIWSDKSKLRKWQEVELAVILAREQLNIFPAGTYQKIKDRLDLYPIDEEAVLWWKARDKEIHHDLNAFLDERLRHLPSELHQFWHKGMTSFDTEEPAMALLLGESVLQLDKPYQRIKGILLAMAAKYRYTPMLGRTHGQEAKLQSFGKRCLTWLNVFLIAYNQTCDAYELRSQSKLSGAIGNYQGLSWEEEAKALEILGLKPFIGATQIMPRIVYLPLANSLEMVVISLTQIAEDIRLGARSGNPIFQEPFGKKQKGSSAMPHKKNTITCENQIGMLTMAQDFAQMLRERAITWEERAIEQSSTERIAWPDLFHVTMKSFKNMIKVLDGLQVFPDNMMLEIINSKGCYASEDAKDWLKEKFTELKLKHEDAYRIVQLASFRAHQVHEKRQDLRDKSFSSLSQADEFWQWIYIRFFEHVNIMDIIESGQLMPHSELEASQQEIDNWNDILQYLFMDGKTAESWKKLFSLEYQLRGEPYIFQAFGL
jgi:adenylosuccinate lyase